MLTRTGIQQERSSRELFSSERFYSRSRYN